MSCFWFSIKSLDEDTPKTIIVEIKGKCKLHSGLPINQNAKFCLVCLTSWLPLNRTRVSLFNSVVTGMEHHFWAKLSVNWAKNNEKVKRNRGDKEVDREEKQWSKCCYYTIHCDRLSIAIKLKMARFLCRIQWNWFVAKSISKHVCRFEWNGTANSFENVDFPLSKENQYVQIRLKSILLPSDRFVEYIHISFI